MFTRRPSRSVKILEIIEWHLSKSDDPFISNRMQLNLNESLSACDATPSQRASVAHASILRHPIALGIRRHAGTFCLECR
jgi:hypothetical protein